LLDRLEHALAHATRHRGLGALLFVDLDNFKSLNDSMGHDTGDMLLQQVAGRLSACTRTVDTVARLGGDEFVVLLEDLSHDALEAASQAEAVAEKIIESLNRAYEIHENVHFSSPSIGITLFGEHPEKMGEPLKRADAAMYQAKAAGRNTLCFFDPQTQSAVNARLELESGLRVALQGDQFVVHYQAQVDAEGAVVGAELLLRWQHPKRGLVPPGEFIGLAEETRLIIPIGAWVLEQACRQLAQWAGQPQFDALCLSVNVSARQFHDPNFVQCVMDILNSAGARPNRLKIELTESLLVNNVEDVIVKMTALKKLGVGFSLDDFGTGYSSLSYLKRLPLDQLKIDQGFVRDILDDPNDAAIAKMVVALAGSLSLDVIAEGVETREQQDFLRGLGCTNYQGYLFSRPVRLDQFLDYVKQSGPRVNRS
jgi:diguanylate cyclase (GGDEF)-like protein